MRLFRILCSTARPKAQPVNICQEPKLQVPNASMLCHSINVKAVSPFLSQNPGRILFHIPTQPPLLSPRANIHRFQPTHTSQNQENNVAAPAPPLALPRAPLRNLPHPAHVRPRRKHKLARPPLPPEPPAPRRRPARHQLRRWERRARRDWAGGGDEGAACELHEGSGVLEGRGPETGMCASCAWTRADANAGRLGS